MKQHVGIFVTVLIVLAVLLVANNVGFLKSIFNPTIPLIK